MKRTVIFLLIMSLTQSFALAQKYQRPKVETPKAYRADPNPTPDAQTLADTKWFEIFKDEKLQNLVREALVHNYDLREAVARIDLARATHELLALGRSREIAAHALMPVSPE